MIIRKPKLKTVHKVLLLLILCVISFNVSKTITTKDIKYLENVEYNYVTPSVITSKIDWWIDELKKSPRWDSTLQRRVDAIERVRFLSYHNMPKFESGRPLALTTYKVVDGELLPKEIIFSQTITFDSLGMKFVVFHELGHAILMLDDMDSSCHQFDEQIMWHKGLDSYYKFGNPYYFRQRLIDQMRMKDDSTMIREMLSNYKKNKPMESRCDLIH